MRVAFDAGFTHYDDPPPAQINDIEALRSASKFRFANVLKAWVETDSAGQITGCGYAGGGLIGDTTVRLGGLSHTFQNAMLPDLRWRGVVVVGEARVEGHPGAPGDRFGRDPGD